MLVRSFSGLPYRLAIPPLTTLTSTERTALEAYFIYSRRIQCLTRLPSTALYSYLTYADQRQQQAIPGLADATGRAQPMSPRGRPYRHDIRLASVVPSMFFNAIKYTMVWYLFTQDESWVESSVWAAGLMAWWIWEGVKEWRRLAVQERASAVAATPAPATVPPPPTTLNSSSPHAEHAIGTPTTDATTTISSSPPQPARPFPTFTLPASPTPAHYLSLLGLAYESHLLQLTPSSRLPFEARRRGFNASTPSPPSLVERLLLPPLIFLLTFLPPLEQHRSSAIRAREKVMREIMLSSSTPTSATSTTSTSALPFLPPGLVAPEAKAYYLRVWERGERIDWQAEAEAQREVLEREEREREEAEGRGNVAGFFF